MSKSLVRVQRSLAVRRKPAQRTELPGDVSSRADVEVVSPQDERNNDQCKKRTEAPQSFYSELPAERPPLAAGASVSLETFLGFLEAAKRIVAPESSDKMLSSAKLTFQNGPQPRLFVETSGDTISSLVALDAEKTDDKGFQVVMPIANAIGVLRGLRTGNEKVVVGVDKEGVCIGPNSVPFGGNVANFPGEPDRPAADAKAALPAFYLDEIVSRVLPARGKPGEGRFDSVVLDFDYEFVDGQRRSVCTAVATDDHRLHALTMPRMVIEPIEGQHWRLPRAMLIDARLFRYLRSVVNRDWAAIDVCANQLRVKGADFAVIAQAASGTEKKDIRAWRDLMPDYGGFWMADQRDLERVLRSATSDDIRICMDGLRNSLSFASLTDGARYREEMAAKDFGGASTVDVVVNKKLLLDAVKACRTGLVRMEFNKDLLEQKTSPIVIRGDDELFRAVVMPIAKETR